MKKKAIKELNDFTTSYGFVFLGQWVMFCQFCRLFDQSVNSGIGAEQQSIRRLGMKIKVIHQWRDWLLEYVVNGLMKTYQSWSCESVPV